MDDELVTINHRLTSKGISAIPQIFTSYYYEDEMGYKYEYRPITLTTFAIEHQFFGENPFVSHLINLLLYFICCCLFILVLKQLLSGFNELFILFSALIFIFHPLHTEAVTSIKNRDELLSLLLALMAFQQALLFVTKGKIYKVVLTPLLLLAGILSKTSCLSFFLIIPLAGVLISEMNFKRNLILFISLLPVLYFFLLLKGYPLVWTLYLATAIVLVLTLVILLRNNGWKKKIADALISFGLPEETALVKISISEISIVDILLYASVTVFCIVAYLKNIFLLLLIPISFLLFTFFWIKKVRLDILILLAFVFSFSIVFKENFYSLIYLSLFLFFMVERVQGHTLIKLLPAAILILTISVKSFSGSHSHIGSILVAIIFLVIQKYIRSRYIKFSYIIYWLLVFIVQLIVININKRIPIDEVYYFIFYIFTILMSAGFTGVKRLVSFVALSFVTVIFLYGDITDKHKDIFSRQSKIETLDANGSIQQTQKAIILSVNSDQVKSSPEKNFKNFFSIQAEDRPLDFVEYPLGFSSTFSEKIGTASYVLGYYLKMMFIPYPMCFYYGYNKINLVPLSSLWTVFSITLHILLGIFAFYFIRKHPIYSIGVFAYLSSIFLFSNLVSPVAGMIGDRLTFTASFGFCIAVGYGLSRLYEVLSFGKRKVFIGIFAIVMVAYSILTISRNAQWRDHLTLYRHDIKHLDKSAQANNLLATRLVFESNKSKRIADQEKLRREAIIYYQRALEIYPSFFNAQYNLARTYELVREGKNAIREYEKTIAIDSLFISPYIQIALIYEAMNQPLKSVIYYQKLIEIAPNDLQVYNNLSALQFKIGNLREAIEINLKAVEKFPFAYEPVVNIGKTYFTMGDRKNALIYFEKAYKLNSSDPNLSATIISICNEFGDFEKANYYIQLTRQ